MPKLIREGRFGPPKSFKTGSVVGTYPKPLVVLSLDQEGLSVIPARGNMPPAGLVKLDTAYEDIVTIKPSQFEEWKKKPTSEQPRVLCIDFASGIPQDINLTFSPQPDSQSFPSFIGVANSMLRGPWPWKTCVLDNTTSLSEIIKGFLFTQNPKAFSDARQWASAIGEKIKVVVAEFCKLPCHFVVLMHEATDKNETTGEIRTEPMIYSQYRQIVGGVVSSFFHQKKVNGKPLIDTTDMAYVKGIGPRWPTGLPPECGVDFMSIYGESVRTGEIEKP